MSPRPYSPGCRYGLAGPNGSGKTTFMKLLTGEQPPRKGTAVRPGVEGTRPYREPAWQPAPRWRTWLFGRPLPTAGAAHQAISKTAGLAVFSSDALSSTAYATQEIMIILALADAASLPDLAALFGPMSTHRT